MREYIQGLITGGVFVFAFMVLIASQKPSKKHSSKTYRSKLIELEDRVGMVESLLKENFRLVGENFLFLKNTAGVSSDTDYNMNSLALIKEPYLLDKLYKIK